MTSDYMALYNKIAHSNHFSVDQISKIAMHSQVNPYLLSNKLSAIDSHNNRD